MRRALLAGSVFVGALLLPLLPATTASAVGAHVICVQSSDASCAESAASIKAALVTATTNQTDDLILVGPGTYSDGPYLVPPAAHTVDIQGAGEGSTVLTLPVSAMSQAYVTMQSSTISDLTIQMAGASSVNDKGLVLNAATADHVTVSGAGTANATGVQMKDATLRDSSVLMPTDGSADCRGIFSTGGATVSDTTVSGYSGYTMSSKGETDTLFALAVRADYEGVVTDGGTMTLSDVSIDLGSAKNSTGILAGNFNPGVATKSITADHVTVSGGGSNSIGVYAYAAAAGARTTSTVALTNSVVWGPATSIRIEADNNGAQGGPSIATVTTGYSDWHTSTTVIGSHGAGGLTENAGRLDVDPLFVGSGDLHVKKGSPVVDQGDPAAGGPAVDLGGHPRVADGDSDGVAVRDMGAYERPDTPPATKITSKVAKKTKAASLKIRFRSEPHATFTCRLDTKAWKHCTSPWKVALPLGKHTLAVRATDAGGHTDPTPATAKVTRIR